MVKPLDASYEPTPEEIEQKCREIRAQWSERKQLIRAGLVDEDLINLELLRNFVAQHGWEKLTQNTRVEDVHLGMWVTNRRREYKEGTLANWLVSQRKSIPDWHW